MRVRIGSFMLALVMLASALIAAAPAAASHATDAPGSLLPRVAFRPIGTYATGLGEGSAEIVAYGHRRMYITNSDDNSLDIVDISDPAAPALVKRVDLAPYGAGPNSVAVSRSFVPWFGRPSIVAVAIEADPKTDPGVVAFFDADGHPLGQVTVGALPDMLTFTPNGRTLLVANEGEPNDDFSIDPEGSVSIIDVRPGPRRTTRFDVTTAGFSAFEPGGALREQFDERTRIFGPAGSLSVAQNLEPEYITVAPDGRSAWVTLQENNAVAVLDIRRAAFTAVVALGTKDHSQPGSGLDASDRDDAINIANWPVQGFFMPDAIASYRYRGDTYLVTANEGDARDYDAYAEEARVKDLLLDPAAFPDAAALQQDAALGRLTVTTANGDSDGDGEFEELYSFGARSFSIWTAGGELVWDSGDQFERITAATYPAFFNANGDSNSFDSRSDNKGPEPEAVTVGRIGRSTYAFVGLERIGGVMVYDVTNPAEPIFVQYVNTRDFSGDFEAGTAGDISPEGIVFIPHYLSPTRTPLLLVSHELSGTVVIFEAQDIRDNSDTLTLLHNNDGESSLLPFVNNAGGTAIPVGGVAAFKTLTDEQIRDARAAGNSVVNVYAGDSFLASSTLACSLPPNPADTPVYDAVAQRQIAYDAHIIGNHEFDFSPDFLERFIRAFTINGVLVQPFLSANLDFSGEPGFADLIDEDGLLVGYSTDGRVVARSAIITDKVTGQRYGVVGATTPQLPTISSPRDVQVTPDLESTAEVVQAEIDRLQSDRWAVERIIFVSHLQSVANDQELIPLLSGVDVAVAGGGDELLINPELPAEDQLLPGEEAPIGGTYPLEVVDADGRTVYIVTTAGNYKYLGRIDLVFDHAGEVVEVISAASYPRRVIPTSDAATALGIADVVEPDPGIVATVIEPVEACLANLAEPIIGSEVLLDVSRAGARGAETNAGNLITDAFLYAYDQYAAASGLPARDATVVAVQNGGGIRQNAGDVLPVGGVVPGLITRQNTLDVLAFLTNSVTAVREVTPEEFKQILERSASRIGGGQFLQIGGFEVVYDLSQTAQVIDENGVVTTPGNRVVSATLSDGTPIVENGAVVAGAPNLTIVTNSFTASGGDNYPWFATNPNKVQFPATYEQAWVEYMLTFAPATIEGVTLPTIPASDPRYQPGGEGRITFAP